MRWAIFYSPILVSLEINKPFLSKATFTFSQLTHFALQLFFKKKRKKHKPLQDFYVLPLASARGHPGDPGLGWLQPLSPPRCHPKHFLGGPGEAESLHHMMKRVSWVNSCWGTPTLLSQGRDPMSDSPVFEKDPKAILSLPLPKAQELYLLYLCHPIHSKKHMASQGLWGKGGGERGWSQTD